MNSEVHTAMDLDQRLADAIERLGNGMRALAQQSARAQSLSPLQQQAVLTLFRRLTVRHEVNALAAEFDVTTPTMSDAISALERKQLITRSPTSDGRRRVLTLTPLGVSVARELTSWDEPLRDALAKLPTDDRAATLHSLLRVVADLQRRGVMTAARMCTSCRFFQPNVYDDPAVPHHCALLGAPLPLIELRTDCPEHQPA